MDEAMIITGHYNHNKDHQALNLLCRSKQHHLWSCFIPPTPHLKNKQNKTPSLMESLNLMKNLQEMTEEGQHHKDKIKATENPTGKWPSFFNKILHGKNEIFWMKLDGWKPNSKREMRHINKSQWVKLIWIKKQNQEHVKIYIKPKNVKTIRDMPILIGYLMIFCY